MNADMKPNGNDARGSSRRHPQPHPTGAVARVGPLQALVLIAAVASGVALTWVLAEHTARAWFWGVLATLLAIYGICRAVAPPTLTLARDTATDGTIQILRMRREGDITTDEAQRLIAALHHRPDTTGSADGTVDGLRTEEVQRFERW